MLQKLRDDLKVAMREKNITKKVVLQGLIGNYNLKEKESKHELSEAEGIEVLTRELKLFKESLDGAEKAGREDLINDAKEKIAIIESYLPKQLSEEEIRQEIQKAIDELGLDTSNKGLMMKTLNPMFKGKANGKLVNQIVMSFIK